MKNTNLLLNRAAACAAVAWLCWNPGNICQAQNPAPGLSPDLQEVVKLTQAKMGDDVIRNYIISTGRTYRLSADDIIYLNSQGVSSGVIGALQATAAANPNPPPVAAAPSAPPPPAPTGPAPYAQPPLAPSPIAIQVAVTAEAPPPPAPEVNFQYFHDQLAHWGVWISLPGVGMVWKPADAVIAASPGWRPYYDNGQWVQTDNGLFWQSDYTWGDIPFHYGRWIQNPVYGWLWAPDYVWGPAWVFWRHAEADEAVGWAPLPFGAVFVEGGFLFNGVRVGLDFDFGLHEDCFVFVDGGHFHERFFRLRGREWRYHVDHDRMHGFYGHSVIRNEFHRDEHGRFVNNGIGRERLEHLNNHVERAHFEERHPLGDRDRAARPMVENHGGVNHGEPNRAQPTRTEPTRTEPNRSDPKRTDPKRTEPNRSEPGGATHGPGGTVAGTTHGGPQPPSVGGGQTHGTPGSSSGGVSKVFRPPVASPQPNRPAASGSPQHPGGGAPQRK